MRVAVVVRSLKIGGMERVAVNLSESFADNEHEAHLIYFKDKDRAFTPKKSVNLHLFDLEKILINSIIGIPFYIFAKFFNILFRRTYFFWQGVFLSPIFKYKIKKLEKQHGKFDLIIMRGHGTFESLWRLKDKRIVQMVESIFIAHETSRDKFYLKCVYNNKNLACVSSGVKNKVTTIVRNLNLTPKSITRIHNPIDLNLILKKSKEYQPQIKNNYIVSVGRITPNKNLDLLVDAYCYAIKNFNITQDLVIVGNGPNYDKIKNKIDKLEYKNKIHMLGLLDNPFPWIKNADLFTLTSFAEGLGMVLLEALACDTKIISTDAKGGIRDILKDELQESIASFDKKEYAKKMFKILKKENLVNNQKYLDKFLPKTIVNKYISTYIS